MHCPPVHESAVVWSQMAQAPPPLPQVASVDCSHALPLQQPFGHELAVHWQLPFRHCWPAGQAGPPPQVQVPIVHASVAVESHAMQVEPPPPQLVKEDVVHTPLAQQPLVHVVGSHIGAASPASPPLLLPASPPLLLPASPPLPLPLSAPPLLLPEESPIVASVPPELSPVVASMLPELLPLSTPLLLPELLPLSTPLLLPEPLPLPLPLPELLPLPEPLPLLLPELLPELLPLPLLLPVVPELLPLPELLELPLLLPLPELLPLPPPLPLPELLPLSSPASSAPSAVASAPVAAPLPHPVVSAPSAAASPTIANARRGRGHDMIPSYAHLRQGGGLLP